MIDIKAERQERSWSQQELAKRANMSQSMVSMLENKSRKPSVKCAKRLAKVFEKKSWREFV